MRWKLALHQKIAIQVSVGIIVFTVLVTLLIHFEKDSNQSSIVDYPNAVWYAIVTLSSVGYGDLYPATTYGRGIGYIFVLLSLGVYALFVGRIAAFMTTLRENKKLGYHGTSFGEHTIIIGWNEISRNVTDQLIGVHKKVAIVTNQVKSVDAIHEKYQHHKDSVFALHAEYSSYESLNKVNIEEANVIFLNFENDMDKLVYLLNAKKLHSSKNYVVILDNSDLKNAFLSAGAIYVVAKNEIASKMLASYIFEPDVAEYSEDIISYAEDDMDYDIKQYRVNSSNPYRDREYQYAFFDLKKRFNVVLIGISKRDSAGKRMLVKNPSGRCKIEVSDYLLVILNGKSSEKLADVFNISEGI